MSSPDVRTLDTLSDEHRGQVADLQNRAFAVDGVRPLSEQTLLHLTAGAGRVLHLLGCDDDGGVQGYLQVADPDDPQSASAELVVDPHHRGHGVGRRLVDALLERAPSARLWAHGNLPAAQALAATVGLKVGRELHKMSRPLGAVDAALSGADPLPAGFSAHGFVPGRDEQAWLTTNAAAFAHHPEQGRMTLADLHDRMTQPWFDPAGLILVAADDRPGDVAAFHWTKVDPQQRSTLDPDGIAGEIYVVGVHPAYQGRGLGRPVTALGLSHLAGLGLPEVVLYVDGDNTAAIRTYTGLGFRSIMVDVMYSSTVHQPLSG